jgi:hypothetical protein
VDASGSATYQDYITPTTVVQGSPGVVSDGAGGALVFWHDERDAGGPRAMRVTPSGVDAAWPAEGLVLSTHPGAAGMTRTAAGGYAKLLASVTSDGAGGAYIAWTDLMDPANGDIRAQHVRADGTLAPGWPDGGLMVCGASGDQKLPTVSGDGEGGLLVTWQDARAGNGDIYVQRLSPTGTPASNWPEGGLAVCTADSLQEIPLIVDDGAHGAVIAWVDHRHGLGQIYASRVTYDAVVPVIASLVGYRFESDRLRIEWSVLGTREPVEVQRQSTGGGWRTVASVAPNADGRIVTEDRDVVAGTSYDYRITLGPGRYAGEVTIHLPGPIEISLEAPSPNPSSGELSVAFSLPRAASGTISIVDVAGRAVLSQNLGSLEAGRHGLFVPGTLALAPGVYHIVLSMDGRRIQRRWVITR